MSSEHPEPPCDDDLSAAISRVWEKTLAGDETPEATIGIERARALHASAAHAHREAA